MCPMEEFTLRKAIARRLPFNLGLFIDRTERRMFNFDKFNTLMERTVVNFTNISSLVIVEESGTLAQIHPN